nr:MAG TPA: minor tail protein [Caudoviricetes sp.]
MALRKAGLSLTLEGKVEYLSGLQSINNQLRISQAQHKAMAAALGNNAGITATYKANMLGLSSSYQLASQKVDALANRQKLLPAIQGQLESSIRKTASALDESQRKQDTLKTAYAQTKTASDQLKQSQSQLTAEYKTSLSDTKSLKTALDEARQAHKRNSDEVKSAKTAYEQSKQKTAELKAKLVELKTATGEASARTQQAKAAYDASKSATKGYKQSLNELTKELESVKKEAGDLPLKLAQAQESMNKLRNEQQQLHKAWRDKGGWLADPAQQLQGFGSKLIQNGERMNALGNTMTSRVTAPILAGFGAATKAAADFHSQVGAFGPLLSGGKPITNEIRQEMNQLGSASRRMAIDYGASTSEINQGMAELIRTGYSSQQVLGMLPNILNASIASGDKFADVMSVSSQVLSQFNLRGKTYEETLRNSTRVTDSLTYIANATSAGFADLGEGMSYVGPVAHSLNMSVEETASILGILSDNGIQASKGGTALRGALSRLLKPSKQNRKAFEAMGVAVDDFKKGTIKLPDIIDTIKKNTAGWTDEQRAAALAMAFGTEAQTAMNALVMQGGDALRNMTKEAEGAKGATEAIAQSMKELPEFKFKQATAQLKDLGIEIGSKLLPHVLKIVEGVRAWIMAFESLSPATQNAIIKAGLFLAALGPVLKILGNLTKVTGLAFTGVGKLFQALGKFTTPSGIQGAKNALEGVEGAATRAGASASLFSSPWSIAGGVAIAGVAGFVAYLANEAVAPIAAHQQAVTATKGKYQEWFEAVTAGKGLLEGLSQAAKENADQSTKAYEEKVKEVMATNRNIQELGNKLFSNKNWWDNLTYDPKKLIDINGNSTILRFDDLRAKMKEAGVVAEEEVQRVKSAMLEYNTWLGNSLSNTISNYQNHTVVTEGWANAQINAVGNVTKAVVENLNKQQEADVERLKQQKQNLDWTEEKYNQEVAKIQSAYDQKRQVITDAEASIQTILRNAAKEGRELTDAEVLSMIKSYQKLAEGAGQSLSSVEGLMKTFGNNLSILVTSTGLDFLRQQGIIDEATAKTIANLGSTEEKVKMLKEALEKVNEVEPEVKVNVDTSEAAAALDFAKAWNEFTPEEKLLALRERGADVAQKMLEEMGKWDSLTPEEKELVTNIKSPEDFENVMHQLVDWNTLPMETKILNLESQVANQQLLEAIRGADLWNNQEFFAKFIKIDTNSPDAQTQIQNLVNEYLQAQGLPPVNLQTDSNAEDTTEELDELDNTVGKVNGKKATITAEAHTEPAKTNLLDLNMATAGMMTYNGRKATISAETPGVPEATQNTNAYNLAAAGVESKSSTITTDIFSMVANTLAILGYNIATGAMKNTSSTANSSTPGMLGNTTSILGYNLASGAMRSTSSTASTYTPGIFGNIAAVWSWIGALNSTYSKSSTLTTYVDKVYRTFGAHAKGGHIGLHATGGHIPMFAGGAGNVPVGYTGIVGEAGPEIFQVTKRGVTITPLSTGEKMRGIEDVVRQATGNTGKGAGQSITINITIDQPIVRQESDLERLSDMVQGAITKALKRDKLMMKGVAVGHAT